MWQLASPSEQVKGPNWKLKFVLIVLFGKPQGSDSEKSTCSAGDPHSIPGSGRSPGEGNGYPLTSVFLPGESHGQMIQVGYSPWYHKEWDTTE